MQIVRRQLVLGTTDPIQLIDITARVQRLVEESGVLDGLVTLISTHTTARVNLNEREERLQLDMVEFLTRLAPPNRNYRHNLEPVDDRKNAHSHLLGLCMTATESIPVSRGRLMLGEWQSIFFVELDGPRPERRVDIQILGLADGSSQTQRADP